MRLDQYRGKDVEGSANSSWQIGLTSESNRGSKSAYVLQVMSTQHYLGKTIFDLYPTDIEIWPTHRQDLASCWLVSYILPLAVLSSQARNLT